MGLEQQTPGASFKHNNTSSNLQCTFFMSFESSFPVANFSWLLASESFHCVSHIIEVQSTHLSFNIMIGSIQSHQFYSEKNS